jgi:ParB-like chromosome segregation protein Spo0J
MIIEKIKIKDLTAYKRNSRTHSPAQVDQICRSIKEFGFTNPVLIDQNGTIIAGHGRVAAATKLKMTEVPCLRLSNLNPDQIRAYVIADNKLAENAGWDADLLRLELEELSLSDFNLKVLGFEDDELTALLGMILPVDGLTDEDEVPELPVEPVTRIGDLYQLGHHRLLCGDSTKAEDVDRLMGGGWRIWYSPIRHTMWDTREEATRSSPS